jgi:hypothetical protein
MGSLSRARLVIVLVTVGAIAGLALAGPAIGKKHPAPPKSYKGSGRSTYHSEDQACFGAKWSGTGGWHTDEVTTNSNVTANVTSDTIEGNSSYSWEESASEIDADCALELLKGYKPSGGAIWDAGHGRMGADGQEVQVFKQPATPPSTTTNCNHSVIEQAGSAGVGGGGMRLKKEGSSFVFIVSLAVPVASCDYSYPGSAVPGGKVGNFVESSSVTVPISEFERYSKVTITISSDPKQGARPNCGIPSSSIPSGVTVKCSQTGKWQGTLTLYQ